MRSPPNWPTKLAGPQPLTPNRGNYDVAGVVAKLAIDDGLGTPVVVKHGGFATSAIDVEFTTSTFPTNFGQSAEFSQRRCADLDSDHIRDQHQRHANIFESSNIPAAGRIPLDSPNYYLSQPYMPEYGDQVLPVLNGCPDTKHFQHVPYASTPDRGPFSMSGFTPNRGDLAVPVYHQDQYADQGQDGNCLGENDGDFADPNTGGLPGRTTVMMRNVPNDFTRPMLLNLLKKNGFSGKFDFLYMPMDFNSMCALGYAFINLCHPQHVRQFWQRFDGWRKWGLPTKKVCQVCWAGSQIGVQSYVERYRNSPLMHPTVPDDFKPMLFERGVRIQFPPPTRPLKPPDTTNSKRVKSVGKQLDNEVFTVEHL